MHRDPRLDHAGREPFRLHSRPPGKEGWDVTDHHDNYCNQDRQRGYEDVWDANHRDEYREVRQGGHKGGCEEAGWDAAGQEEYREVR